MASLDDILTTQKNGVVAINGILNATTRLAGTSSSLDITSATVVKSGSGWLARVSVTTAGSTTGTIYDSNSASASTGIIYKIPTTAGISDIQFPFLNGLVIVPGTGMIVSVSYT
jgi:hypothetical protein